MPNQIKTLIYIEEREARLFLLQSLRKFNNIIASDLKDALFKAKLDLPDIVFIEVEMSDCKEYEVIHKIKTTIPDSFIIVISSYNDRSSIYKAQAMGASAYMIKPFNTCQIEKYIEQYIKTQQITEREEKAAQNFSDLHNKLD